MTFKRYSLENRYGSSLIYVSEDGEVCFEKFYGCASNKVWWSWYEEGSRGLFNHEYYWTYLDEV